jgi:hypothetical protein
MSTLTVATSPATSTIGNPTNAMDHDDDRFTVEATRARSLFAEQLVVTQSRCVDQLLDLLNMASEPAVKCLLCDFLAEIRKLSAVSGQRVGQMLDLALAATHVESAYSAMVLG